MTIRAAALTDLDAIREIDREAFGAEAYPGFFFRQALDLWGDLLRVAELPSGALAGYALGAVGTGAAWVLSAAVRPGHRGQGIGAALTQDLLACLATRGAGEVRLTVHPENRAAIRLYQNLKFEVAGEEPDYFGPGEPRLVMRRVLERR